MDGETPFFVPREGLTEIHAEIVEHASCLFGTLGYTKTNIGEIAERVGMSPGNLYRYFRNKRAIGEEVVRCYLCHAEVGMTEALAQAAPTAEARLRAMFEAGIGGLLDALRESPPMVELADLICEDDGRGILSAHIAWKQGHFARLMREGEAEGVWRIADPDAMAGTLLDATRAFWMPMALVQIDAETAVARLNAVLDALIAGWRA